MDKPGDCDQITQIATPSSGRMQLDNLNNNIETSSHSNRSQPVSIITVRIRLNKNKTKQNNSMSQSCRAA